MRGQLIAMGMGMGGVPGGEFWFFLGFVRQMGEWMGFRVVLFLLLMALFVPAGPGPGPGLVVVGRGAGCSPRCHSLWWDTR